MGVPVKVLTDSRWGQDRDLQLQWLQDLPWPWQEVCPFGPEDVHIRHQQGPGVLPDEASQPHHQVDCSVPSHQQEAPCQEGPGQDPRDCRSLCCHAREEAYCSPSEQNKQSEAALKELKAKKGAGKKGAAKK